ncbi:MAG: hypothetical protein MUF31_17295 [Akkermansiaceae bacterium]|jgi:hypothetical protein|nr:hypothetical protein [Akkermansiaceae bacterium]
MNDDSELEAMLRSLRPGSLPADLRQNLTHPPAPVGKGPPSRLLWLALPLAAAAAITLGFFLPPRHAPAPAETVTLRQSQSRLVESRSLEVVRVDDELWELAEQKWVDEDLTLCSSSPVAIKLTTTRHERVWQPVRFD